MEPKDQGPVKGIIAWTLKQKVFINLVFVLLMVVGAFCLTDLPVERYPEVKMGKVIIKVNMRGASPSEVEALVTRKIEDALDDLDSVEYIRSNSYRGSASILVKFLDDTDYDALYDELRFKVLSVQKDLPADADPPTFTVIAVSEWLPAINVNLIGDRSNRALVLMAEEMKIFLKRIEGVKEVKVDGEYVREFFINLDPNKLMRYGVTFDEVAKVIQEANVAIPAGSFTSKSGEYSIVVDEKFRSSDKVAKVVVRKDADGSFVRVGDVMSKAVLGHRDPFVVASVNGKDTVSLKVVKAESGNALDVEAEVRKVVDRFRPMLKKEGVSVVYTQRQSDYIEENINTLGSNLLVGMVLVCVCIWIVMGFRNAVLTTVGVPFAFLVTMIIMWITDNSLNEITLFSFVLVSGIIVDDAIVVVENIYRHLQEGKPLKQAAIDGAAEVALPVVAATSTTVAAFLPMLIMSGSTGEFFAQVPKAVTFAIIASIIECLIILPPHFVDWPGAKKLKADAEAHKTAKDPRFMVVLRGWVDKGVCLFLRHKKKTLAFVMLAFFVSVGILGVSMSGAIPLIRIKFFPDDYNVFNVSIEGPAGTDIESVAVKVREISTYVTKMGTSVSKSCTGLAGMDIDKNYENIFDSKRGIVIMELPRKGDRIFPGDLGDDPVGLLSYLRKDLKRFAKDGWSLRVWPQADGPPTGSDVNIRILGTDQDSVMGLKDEIMNWIKANKKIGPELVNLKTDMGTDSLIFRFNPDPGRVAEYGLSASNVASLAGSVLDGRYVGKFRVQDEDVDLKLRIDRKFLKEPEDSLGIPVLEHGAGPVRLGDLCTITIYREPGQFNRFQGQRAVTITADFKQGTTMTAPVVVHDVRQFYESIRHKYPGAAVNFAGEFESTGRSFQSLAYAFLIALFLIYSILSCQFQSYTQPMIIMSAVVFALTGVILGTFFTRSLFTINSFIATVGVTGVVVNDSLVLLDFMNKLYRSGKTREQAIREAVGIRLRPIMLTTLTTTLGLLPMAMGIPSYSLVWGTMATTFVTGLCTATTLTLFVIPLEWDLLMRFKEWQERRKAAKEAAS